MNISQRGIDLIKQFEGCRLTAYDDLQPNVKVTSPKQVKGKLTIGYGHTGNVQIRQTINKKQAEDLLKKDLQKYVQGVLAIVKVPLNQNQLDALVSFSYNLGVGALAKSSLLTKLNAKDYAGAASQFTLWVRSDGNVLSGLVTRRTAEMKLFSEKSDVGKPPVVKLESVKPTTVKVTSPKKSTKNYQSLVEYLIAHNQPHDFVSRHKLADKLGIKGYNGTPDQNILLLKKLQG